jgi:hypothetical protein
LRALVRQELNDAGGTPAWTDAQLNQWLGEAIRRYSRELPKESSTTIAVVSGQAGYTLPADCDRVLRVEQPSGTVRIAGERGQPGYRVFGGRLLLDPAPGATGASQDVQLEYLARYAEPAADGDTLATPAADDDLLIALVCARALGWLDLDEAKRQRFERQRGVSVREVARAYESRAEEVFRGRKRRVEVRVLEVG